MTTTIETPHGPSSGGSGKPRVTPPEWPIEIFIKKIGRIPAAAGRALDRAAKVPVLGLIVRRLSSVWLGITLLALIGLYIAIGSGMPGIRARMEMTDLQFFDALPMRILLGLLAIDLIFVTLRRIPLTLFKLGSWTVHTGILTLITGCVWYFSMKEEGAARMYLNKPVTQWYDVGVRALYSFPVKPDGTFDTEHATITELPTLPIYYEHIADANHSNPLNISLSGAIQAGGAIDATVVGYYPFATLHTASYRAAQPGERTRGPAITVTLTTARDSMPDMWLQSDNPLERSFELNRPFTMEFLNRPGEERMRDLQTSFEGRAAVTVRVPKLKIEKTIVLTVELIEKQTPIPIEGTPYTVTIEDGGDIPMRSKGYEGTHSTNLMIAVSRKDGDKTFEFKRMSLSRYPERSPDFVMEGGKQVRKQDGVDPDVDIIFHDASRTNAWIVETDNGTGGSKLQAIVRTTAGKSTTVDVTDKPIEVPVDGIPGFKMVVTKHLEKSVAVQEPQIVPVEQRPKALTALEIMRFSAIELEIKAAGGAIENVFVPFAHYGAVDDPDGTLPTVVYIPGRGHVGLLLSTARRELPTTVTLTDFKPVKFPGATRSYMDYVSTLQFDDGKNPKFSQVSHLNRPVYDKGLIYFQSQWDGDDNAPPEKRFSVMGIANRPGMWVMIAGSILMAMGIGYAFYVKPILLKYKKESLAAWNAARNPSPAQPHHG